MMFIINNGCDAKWFTGEDSENGRGITGSLNLDVPPTI